MLTVDPSAPYRVRRSPVHDGYIGSKRWNLQNYAISSMVERRSGTRALVPVIEPPAGLERAYLARLRRLLHEAARVIREVILPAYQRRITTDAEASDFNQLERVLAAIARTLGGEVADLMRLESERHTKAWMAAARRAFGVNLASVVRSEDLGDYLEAAALRNAGLIKGLTDDLVKNVQTTVTNSVIAGDSVTALQKKIKWQLHLSDNRARLIARDQTSKLNSDLNRIRHQQAGIESYIWRTSKDERVRLRHQNLEGNKYKYGEPTGAEEGLPPGQPIQCRCIAQAVVEFGEPSKTTPPPKTTPAPNGGTIEDIVAPAQDAGVKNIKVQTGQEGGSYRWTAIGDDGFEFSGEEDADRLYVDYLTMPESLQGVKVGREMINRIVRRAAARGKVVDLDANMEVGAYVWAKAGWRPTDLLDTYERVREKSFDVLSRKYAGSDLDRRLSEVDELLGSDGDYTVYDNMLSRLAHDPDGKEILAGFRFNGRLDTKDKSQMEEFSSWYKR